MKNRTREKNGRFEECIMYHFRIKNMNNLLVGDLQVEVLEVVEGFLDATDMPCDISIDYS